MRTCIVAPSGAGKTNLCLNLLGQINAFTKIYIIARSFDTEPLYMWLIDGIREMEEKLSKKTRGEVKILMLATNTLEDLPEIDDFDPSERNLIIFDDLVTETSKVLLKKMADLWIRGRRQNCSTLYLSQDYHGIPAIMRRNTTHLLLKALGTTYEKRAILRESARDMTKEQMDAMFRSAEPEKLENFFLIDMSSAAALDPSLRYRRNFEPIMDM